MIEMIIRRLNMEVHFYGENHVGNEQLKFAVIVSRYNGKWILCKHEDRNTWEIPGGTREEGEDIDFTASRELEEETGAIEYDIKPICIYGVTRVEERFGKLFFAEVKSLNPVLQSEIELIDFFDKLPDNLTYPDIQPKLFRRVLQELKES